MFSLNNLARKGLILHIMNYLEEKEICTGTWYHLLRESSFVNTKMTLGMEFVPLRKDFKNFICWIHTFW